MSLLIDSSVWIDFFNGVNNRETAYLQTALGQEQIFVGDLILLEVLQGFQSQKDFDTGFQALSRFPIVSMAGQSIAVQSAANYRLLRGLGITIRKTIDTIIATFCMENRLMLVHRDRDFDPFEQHFGLQVWHHENSRPYR